MSTSQSADLYSTDLREADLHEVDLHGIDLRGKSLLVIIPAFNEQGAIRQVVKGVYARLPNADTLVIDDGSRDNTAYEAQAAGAFVVRHPFNLGIGGAVQTGLKFAQQHGYDYVIRIDGDGQHSVSHIQAMLTVLQNGQADMVIGSRFLNADVDWHIPLTRRLGIRLYALEVTWLTGSRFTDGRFRAVHRTRGRITDDPLSEELFRALNSKLSRFAVIPSAIIEIHLSDDRNAGCEKFFDFDFGTDL